MNAPGIRTQLDWGKLAPLRLKARTLCDGLFAGGHRSVNRGDGVEFGGHRQYMPGDDLRWLDARAALRTGKLLIREFEAERQRTVSLLMDASESMAFRSQTAPGAKLAYGALIAASLAYIAVASHDAVGLGWFGGEQAAPMRRMFGQTAFESVVSCLEEAQAGGELVHESSTLQNAVDRIAALSPPGSVVLVVSDLVDLPERARDIIAGMARARRSVVVLQVLDPAEAEFTFKDPARLVAAEGNHVTEISGQADQSRYLSRLQEIRQEWRESLIDRGGRLVTATTTDAPLETLRRVLRAIEGRAL